MTHVIHINGRRTTVAKEAAMHTKSGRKLSEHAAAAKMIRKDLRKAWPSVKFSITSESFAGGDAVNISWTDGPTTDEVDALVWRYQSGHFGGMIDLYEYSNPRHDIPQAKYVQTQRSLIVEAKREAVDWLNARYSWSLRINETSKWGEVDHTTDFHTGNGWASHEVHRVMHDQPLICRECESVAHVGDDYCGECGTRITSEDLNR